MSSDATRIDEPKIDRDAKGRITSVSLAFGPHHFVQVDIEAGRVHCAIGATHHGIRADAAQVNSDFEQRVEELRRAHPNHSF